MDSRKNGWDLRIRRLLNDSEAVEWATPKDILIELNPFLMLMAELELENGRT